MTTMTQEQTTESATSPEVKPMTVTEDVSSVRTMDQLNQTLALIEKQAGDLVASQVVREGYMAHGHPADLGFIHLNSMTNSRIKKAFPLANKSEPLFRILYAKGKHIVGEGLVKKYEARRDGKKFDHCKWIDGQFKKLFEQLSDFKEVLAEIGYDK